MASSPAPLCGNIDNYRCRQHFGRRPWPPSAPHKKKKNAPLLVLCSRPLPSAIANAPPQSLLHATAPTVYALSEWLLHATAPTVYALYVAHRLRALRRPPSTRSLWRTSSVTVGHRLHALCPAPACPRRHRLRALCPAPACSRRHRLRALRRPPSTRSLSATVYTLSVRLLHALAATVYALSQSLLLSLRRPSSTRTPFHRGQ